MKRLSDFELQNNERRHGNGRLWFKEISGARICGAETVLEMRH